MRRASGLRATVGNLRRRLAPSTQGPIATVDAVVDGEYLHKLDRLSLALGHALVHGLMGEHLSTRRTSGIEFADYRQYSAGDDLRRVDWNAYARLGSLHVRQSQAEHDTVLYLMLDASPSMGFGRPTKFLAARRLAAGLGYIALAHLDSVALAAPGAGGQSAGQLTTFRGRAQSAGLFRELQAMVEGAPAEFDGALKGWSVQQAGGTGRLAVLISDLLLDGWRDGLRGLVSAGFGVTVLHVLSPDDLEPPEEGDFQMVDSETGEQLDVHLGPAGLLEYSHRLHTWLGETEAWCLANGANYIRVGSNWEIERTLLDLLRRRGVTA